MRVIILDVPMDSSTMARSLKITAELEEQGYVKNVDFECFHTYRDIRIRFLTDKATAMETYIRMMYI